MHLAYVSCALIAGVIAASIPAPMQGQFAEKHFLLIQQQIRATYPHDAVTGSIVPAQPVGVQQTDADETADLGRGLTCEQIRIMDEVELITDDSYCT